MRITKSHVEAKVSIVNDMLGYEAPQWNTIGAVRLYGAYGGYGVHQVMSTSGGVTELAPIGTLREAAQFLSGMIAGLRISETELRPDDDHAENNADGIHPFIDSARERTV